MEQYYINIILFIIVVLIIILVRIFILFRSGENVTDDDVSVEYDLPLYTSEDPERPPDYSLT